jgi:hypothetical protein
MAILETKPRDGQVIGFLVEIDAILDTRLGMMDVLHPESAVRLVQNRNYFHRLTDKFEGLCGFPDLSFRAAWKGRTKDVLLHSLNTPSLDLLHFSVMEAEHKAATHPMYSGVRIDVNVYPYDLTMEERECMAASIAQRAGWKAPIRIIRQPPYFFHPQMVKEDYSVMMLYNYREWLEIHKEALTGFHRMPGVTLFLPRLQPEERIPSEIGDFRRLGARQPVDIFEAVTYACTEFVSLEFIPINHFCIAYPGLNDIPVTIEGTVAAFEKPLDIPPPPEQHLEPWPLATVPPKTA